MTVSDDPPFVTGAWRDGDPVGHRAFVDFPELHLERGGVLPSVRVAYETWGTLNPAGSNAILVEHALTGDSHVVGAAGPGHASPGWWEGLVGPGRDLDTDEWFVVAANVIGGCQGSTGPASPAPDGRPWGSRFPFVTIRDQVAAEAGTPGTRATSRVSCSSVRRIMPPRWPWRSAMTSGPMSLALAASACD